MAANHDIPPAQKDIRWFIVWAAQEGYPKPTSADMEAFAERVAIRIVDGGQNETMARLGAAQEWGLRCRP